MTTTWPTRALGEVAKIERSGVAPQNIVSGTLYVGLENITSQGEFDGQHPVASGDLASQKFAFTSDHVLYGKLRPYLAKIACPGFSGICSTDILPIRPGPMLDKRFLLHFLRQPAVVSIAASLATGANLPRLNPKVLEGFEVSVPPFDEQRRIVAILDKADEVRARCRDANDVLGTLSQAIFVEAFGNPSNNPKGWTVLPLGEVASQVTDGEHATPKRSSEGVKLLSARNVRDGYFDLSQVDHVSAEVHAQLKARCNPVAGDILISCSGTIGRIARVPGTEPFSLVRSVALVRPIPEKVRPAYLEFYLRNPEIRQWMVRRAHSSAQANLFQNHIRAIPVMVPALGLQDAFEKRVEQLTSVQLSAASAVTIADELFGSLQHQAFQGGL